MQVHVVHQQSRFPRPRVLHTHRHTSNVTRLHTTHSCSSTNIITKQALPPQATFLASFPRPLSLGYYSLITRLPPSLVPRPQPGLWYETEHRAHGKIQEARPIRHAVPDIHADSPLVTVTLSLCPLPLQGGIVCIPQSHHSVS